MSSRAARIRYEPRPAFTQVMQRSATTRRLPSDGAPHALRAGRRSGHGAQPLRAARAARPAERRGDRRAPPPGRDRPRPGRHLHGDDRRPGQRHRRCGARARGDADVGRRRPHRLRHRRRGAVAGRAPGGAAGAALAPGPARHAATASPRACSSAGRWASSTRRARGRSWPPSSPSEPRRRAPCPSASPSRWALRSCCWPSRWAGAPWPGACGPRARPGPAARAGRRPRPHRRRHGDEPRRALPVGHRQPSARGARQPDARPRDLARRRPAG